MNSLRRFTRGSRADVLWSLSLFAASQLGLAIAIEWRLPELRDPRYACRAAQLVRRTKADGARPLSIVMLGSSRVQDGFNSSELESRLSRQFGRPMVVFNFGLPGAGPVANLLHFERLISAGVKPDLLLIEVVPMMLRDREGRPQESTYFTADRLWRADLELIERYGMPAGDLRRDWWQDWAAPCHAHRYAIASLLLPQMLPIWMRVDGDRSVDSSGWRLRNAQPFSDEDRRRGREISWNDFGAGMQTFQMCEAACRAQRDLLVRCREERIAAALIWMPEAKFFQGWYPAAVERQIRRHLQQLSKEFEAPLIEARGWVADEGFVDGHHMRHVGAVQFTERLKQEVLEPILLVERRRWGEYLASLQRSSAWSREVIAIRPSADASNSRLR